MMDGKGKVSSLNISIWHSEDIIWHRSGWILPQVMASCLMAPNHYLKQCWYIIKKCPLGLPKSNFTKCAHKLNQKHMFWDHTFEGTTVSLKSQLFEGNTQDASPICKQITSIYKYFQINSRTIVDRAGIILSMRPTNERWCYNLTSLCASFCSDLWIESGATFWKCSIWVKKGDFFFVASHLKFGGWPSKTLRHIFYATSSFVHDFVAICNYLWIQIVMVWKCPN